MTNGYSHRYLDADDNWHSYKEDCDCHRCNKHPKRRKRLRREAVAKRKEQEAYWEEQKRKDKKRQEEHERYFVTRLNKVLPDSFLLNFILFVFVGVIFGSIVWPDLGPEVELLCAFCTGSMGALLWDK